MNQSKYLQVFDNFLSKEECQKMISAAEDLTFKQVDRDIAKYDRVIMINKEFSSNLYERLKKFVRIPEYYNGFKVVGLNDHIRFSKYHPGNEFGIHKDGVNQDSMGNRSVMTLNIFLNDEFDGGETDFFHENKSLRYSAKACPGRAALFDSQQFHCGNKVENGFKYLMRTDVMVSL